MSGRSRFASLLRSRLGRDLGCSSDWQGSAYRVAGVVSGWYLVEDEDLGPRCWHLCYRDHLGGFTEVERSFSALELLGWLRGSGLREFRRVVGHVETCVVPSGWSR